MPKKDLERALGLKTSLKSDSYALGNTNKKGKAGERNQGLCCGRLIVSRKKIKEKKSNI